MELVSNGVWRDDFFAKPVKDVAGAVCVASFYQPPGSFDGQQVQVNMLVVLKTYDSGRNCSPVMKIEAGTI